MNSFILKNTRLGSRSVNILVVNGKIAHVYPYDESNHLPVDLPAELTKLFEGENSEKICIKEELALLPVEDARGLKVMPSLIDAHVHLREPGQEWKETIATGLNAAVRGGFGAVMAMANTDPVNDNEAITRFMIDAAKRNFPNGPRLYPIGALTRNLEGKELAPMAEMADLGCVAFSNDGRPVANSELFRRAMEYANDQGAIVIDHCEDPYLSEKGHMNESELSGRMGLKGQPGIAETIQVARDVLLADYLKLPIHLAHISYHRSVDVVASAKANGTRVTCETCPHYLFLTEDAVKGYNTAAKVNPPLREQRDVDCLRQALVSGVVDILTTDHAPHAAHEKETPMDEAPCGIYGLDTALSLTWELVRQGVISEENMLDLWCYNPGRIFNLPVNTFRLGDPADFFLFDPEELWEVTPETMYSKSKNTPFMGRRLVGKVKAHWLGGHRIF